MERLAQAERRTRGTPPAAAVAQLAPGLHSDLSIEHGGITRSYDVLVPASYDGTSAVPLVIDLHGFGRTKEFQRAQSGFEALAEAQGFIAVWPAGVDMTWNAGAPCTANDTIDDVGKIYDMKRPVKVEDIYTDRYLPPRNELKFKP